MLVHGITYRRDLLGQLNILCESHFALLQRTVQVDIFDLLTEVCFLVDQADQAILDLQENLGTLLDLLAEGTLGDDGEVLTTIVPKYQ